MAASGTAEPEVIGAATAHDIDALVEQIIADEIEELKRAFTDGAEFAITRAGRRDETLHRLECPSLEPALDRRARWTEEHRRRLQEDREYRIPLPALLTRDQARATTVARSCRVCWPNITGTEPRPLKRLTAGGLRPRHAGRVLATETGESLGTIIRAAAYRGADLFGVEHDEIDVVTSARTLRYAPAEPVFLWDLPSDAEAMERRMRLFTRLGAPISPR